MAPKFLYCHGFASSASSAKGVALAAHYARRGVALERLDLRVPSMEHLRLSAMLDVVRDAIGGERDRAVVFGSSLGGLAAARVAERDPRVSALVLLAPAFRGAERWRARLGEEQWLRWQQTGWTEVLDHAGPGLTARVDFEFTRDLAAVDGAGDGWPDVRVPTLILHGTRDEVVDVALSRKFAHGKHWIQLVELDDGHELVASLPTIAAESESFLRPWLGA